MKKEKLRFIDFCAGIGAGRQGLEKNGLKCVGFCEIDKPAEITYRKLHSADETNFGDVTKLNIASLPDFELMIAGFPCQTFSVIGNRKGFLDERGRIVYSLIKVLKEKNIPYFILENVKGLANHSGGKTIATIVEDLESIGYFVDYRILNSLDYGVPQMRERVYFVGIKKDKMQDDKRFEWPKVLPQANLSNFLIYNKKISIERYKYLQKYLGNKYNKGKYDLDKIKVQNFLVLDTRQSDFRVYENKVPTIRAGRQGIFYTKDNEIYELSGLEGLLLQGFEKNVLESIADLQNAKLLKQSGNAMTVNVIQNICKSLLEYVGAI